MVFTLSQQGIWVPFWTPKALKRTSQDTQIFLCGISKNLNLKLIIEFFHLPIIPMTLINGIMPHFDEFIYVYGWNMSIFWSPLKIWTPINFTTAKFRHSVSKSWLRHWVHRYISEDKNDLPLRCETLRPEKKVFIPQKIVCNVSGQKWLANSVHILGVVHINRIFTVISFQK